LPNLRLGVAVNCSEPAIRALSIEFNGTDDAQQSEDTDRNGNVVSRNGLVRFDARLLDRRIGTVARALSGLMPKTVDDTLLRSVLRSLSPLWASV
jgi:hypothetical protein